jgi:23S rRNA (cytosine1962-C5)-methyltransferase
MNCAALSPQGLERLRSGHPWFFPIHFKELPKAGPGEIIGVKDFRGRIRGYGFFSPHSRLLVRLITRQEEEINLEFWLRRLLTAGKKREKSSPEADAYRMVFGDADGFPGLILDRYGQVGVFQSLIPGMDLLLPQLANLAQEAFSFKAILFRNDAEVRKLERLPLKKTVFLGEIPKDLVIREGPLSFRVDPFIGHKTGLYLDQRENRLAVPRYLTGEVLDAFSYQGGFALHAARKASQVWAIEDSEPALETARDNAALNQIPNCRWIKGNVFDVLKRMTVEGRTFDGIVLDPPPFARKKGDQAAAFKGYLELNRLALRCLNPGGILFTFSCSYHLTEPLFLNILALAAAKRNRPLFLLEKRTQARDHPILATLPESYYLKCLIFQSG